MINPFNPGFGNISPSCIKRPAMQQKLLDQADQLQQGFRSIFIDGPRGCGKTVFLNDLGDAMLDRDGWITVDLELHDDFLSTLVGAIYYQSSQCRHYQGTGRPGLRYSQRDVHSIR